MKNIIIGNWKLNLDHLEAIQLLQKINYSLPENIEDNIEIVLAPSFTSIRSMQTVISSDKLKIKLSSQNVSQFVSGSYTGEVSATQLNKLEIGYGIVGHSERRSLLNEVDSVINEKVNRLIESDIVPVFCFGEPIEERKSDNYLSFIENQINELNTNEKKKYMEMIGLNETGLNLLIQRGYKILELDTYFTSGPEETRA